MLDALACPLTAVPRPLRARRQPAHSVPLNAHRLRRLRLLGFRRCAPPPEQVAPGLRHGGRGFAPRLKTGTWGCLATRCRAGRAALSCVLLIGAPQPLPGSCWTHDPSRGVPQVGYAARCTPQLRRCLVAAAPAICARASSRPWNPCLVPWQPLPSLLPSFRPSRGLQGTLWGCPAADLFVRVLLPVNGNGRGIEKDSVIRWISSYNTSRAKPSP